MLTNEQCTEEKFAKWFKSPLTALCQFSDTDFAILLIALPVIERYLREKSGEREKTGLGKPFYDELGRVFPELPTSEDDRKRFWKAFRHGLLHQAAMKIADGFSAVLDRSAAVIEFDATNKTIRVSAPAVARRILQAVENDFSKFEAPSSPNHPIPAVSRKVETPIAGSVEAQTYETESKAASTKSSGLQGT